MSYNTKERVKIGPNKELDVDVDVSDNSVCLYEYNIYEQGYNSDFIVIHGLETITELRDILNIAIKRMEK